MESNMAQENNAPRMGFDYEAALAKDPNVNQADIDNLRECLRKKDPTKHGIVPKNITDQQLLLFHHSCHYKLEDTLLCIKDFYETVANAPEIFDGLELDSPEAKLTLETMEHSFIPNKSPDGDDIIFHRLHDNTTSKFNQLAGIRVMVMTLFACLYERGPSPGIIFLFDMKGVKMAHSTKINFSALRKFLHFVQYALPIRIKAIHIMNTASYYDTIFTLVKPFLKKDLVRMINLHMANEDMVKFHKEVLPVQCLPPDYGGTLSDTQTLNKENEVKLRTILPYFQEEEAQRKASLSNDKKPASAVFGNEID